ncbi:MAG: hypothetical protein SWK76_08080 [Actinomycetota bacterium]|nr:hypothetical protein [Actinomycetota bacterium]
MNALKDLGVDKSVPGWERGDSFVTNVSLDELDAFRAALPSATMVPADPVIWAAA